jgi:spoIIIJ-associated protein
MDAVEASGKTVEEAIERALEELGAGRDEVEVEVLAEPGAGAEARVRVRLIEDADDDDGDGDDAEDVAEATNETAEDAADDDEYIEDEAELAAQMLDRMLELMGVRADVSIRDPETPGDGLGMAKAVLEIEGDDLGLLIGRRGETLTALQFILNLMASRQLGDENFFTLDVEGYRRRRERQLNQLASRMADQVKRTRRPVVLEPMPAHERRIIHLALSNHPQVETASVGEGEDRKVTITPKR